MGQVDDDPDSAPAADRHQGERKVWRRPVVDIYDAAVATAVSKGSVADVGASSMLS